MMLKQRLKEIAPDTNQGRVFLKISAALVALAARCHLFMGSRFAAVLFRVRKTPSATEFDSG